jgi:hypothetical protein
MKAFLATGVILAASLVAWADAPWLANVKVSDDPDGYNQDEVCLAVWRGSKRPECLLRSLRNLPLSAQGRVRGTHPGDGRSPLSLS